MSELTPETISTYIIKIQLNFENAYITTNETERLLLISSWYDALCDYPKEICDRAVKNVLKKAKFAPRLGDITEEADKLLSPQTKSDEELWAELNSVLGRAYDVSRYLSYPQHAEWANGKLDEIYRELSDELKLFVVNSSTLVELAEMPLDTLQFERTRFFKQMPVLKKHRANKAEAQKFLEQKLFIKSLPQSTDT
ncbi:MAG: hypothetical protein K2L72_01855, partial [Clostridia bacterium]|nr:hypothetical protein [Clostridia bacterium]